MNIIKKVSVFVMGIVVIGIVSTAVGVTTQPKNVNKNVTFELLENNELSINVYDKINEYATLLYDVEVDNVVNISVNNDDDIFSALFITYNVDSDLYLITDDYDDEPHLEIFFNNTYYDEFDSLNVGDIVSITFAVEVETPVIIKTLLVLIPLVLSVSVIGYIAVKKGDE